MNKEYEYVYAVIRADEYKGADCPTERRVTVKEIVWDEDEARREVERLNSLGKEGVVYFWTVTRLLPNPAPSPANSAPTRPATEVAATGAAVPPDNSASRVASSTPAHVRTTFN